MKIRRYYFYVVKFVVKIFQYFHKIGFANIIHPYNAIYIL
ncbi:hypothetical protein HmCmsJML155_02151 [Escherichia coli]|nr:hypothetical protein HmCmsJML155_02151 [Escherichia coli]